MCVPPGDVAVLWHVVRPMIEAAYAKVDEYPPVDLLEGLNEGKLLLWVSAPDGEIATALVTALLPRPSGLTCKLMVCGGELVENWHGQIEAYARAEKCMKISAEGRPGWARVLPDYVVKRVILEKRLD